MWDAPVLEMSILGFMAVGRNKKIKWSVLGFIDLFLKKKNGKTRNALRIFSVLVFS